MTTPVDVEINLVYIVLDQWVASKSRQCYHKKDQTIRHTGLNHLSQSTPQFAKILNARLG